MRRVAFCADDYGYNPDVDRAILDLIDLGRLGGTSCMVDAPNFGESAAALRGCDVDIGLHLNLSEAFAGAPRIASLHALMLACWLRTLRIEPVVERINRQLDLFEVAFDRIPDYVDGHQHTHQFPVVRDELLDVLAQRYGTRRPLVRNTLSDRREPKARMLVLLGGSGMHAALLRRNWPTNADFVGAYTFRADADFPGLAERWLATLNDGTIWMCHPAVHAQAGDPIGPFRVTEFERLRSDRFDAKGLPSDIVRVRPSQLAVAG